MGYPSQRIFINPLATSISISRCGNKVSRSTGCRHPYTQKREMRNILREGTVLLASVAFVMYNLSMFQPPILLSYKFDNTVNTYRCIGNSIDEDIGRMHIFQIKTFADIVHSLPIIVVSKSFGCHHVINFLLGSQSPTPDVGLCENCTEQAMGVTCKANHVHRRFREKGIVQDDRFQGST